MADNALDTLFLESLKDVYYTERQILKALPKMERSAKSPDLKQAFHAHRLETEGQVERLQQIFNLLKQRAHAQVCPAIDGIMDEGAEIIEKYSRSSALDAALAATAQTVEHYEIARYGALCTWAETLGQTDVLALLQTTLVQEMAANQMLAVLAQSAISTALAAE